MKKEIIGFYNPEDDYGFLSNWYPALFQYGRHFYTSSEQFMMAQKAFVFGDHSIADEIMCTSDLDAIKALGKKVKNYDDKLWSRIRQPIMRRGIRAKFQQNPELMEKLMLTGHAVLAEAAPRDRIWGIGLSAEDPRVQDPRSWRGQNLLGRTLMQVRADLRRWNAVSGGKAFYFDARDLRANDVWSMPLKQVILLPGYSEAVAVYRDIVRYRLSGRDYLCEEYDGTMEELEDSMRTNQGGGLPAVWFWEMKQEIYDLARFGD